jgi:hypothetical protein
VFHNRTIRTNGATTHVISNVSLRPRLNKCDSLHKAELNPHPPSGLGSNLMAGGSRMLTLPQHNND